MDVGAGLAAVGQAISITKSLRSLEKSYDAVLYKSQIVDLMEALIETKGALADAKVTIEEKDREIASIRAAFSETADLVVGDGDYKFKVDQSGNKVGYPVCPKCEAVSGRVVQLKQDGNFRRAKCPVCEAQHSPVTCYLPVDQVEDEIDTMAKRAAENNRKAMARAQSNRRASWINSRY